VVTAAVSGRSRTSATARRTARTDSAGSLGAARLWLAPSSTRKNGTVGVTLEPAVFVLRLAAWLLRSRIGPSRALAAFQAVPALCARDGGPRADLSSDASTLSVAGGRTSARVPRPLRRRGPELGAPPPSGRPHNLLPPGPPIPHRQSSLTTVRIEQIARSLTPSRPGHRPRTHLNIADTAPVVHGAPPGTEPRHATPGTASHVATPGARSQQVR
jgi:hypothetical protein